MGVGGVTSIGLAWVQHCGSPSQCFSFGHTAMYSTVTVGSPLLPSISLALRVKLSMPPHARVGPCPSQLPCLSYADWCLHSDAMPDARLTRPWQDQCSPANRSRRLSGPKHGGSHTRTASLSAQPNFFFKKKLAAWHALQRLTRFVSPTVP